METKQDRKLTAQQILDEYPGIFSLTTLWRLEKRGDLLPSGRVGKKRVWRQASIEMYLTRDELIQETRGA